MWTAVAISEALAEQVDRLALRQQMREMWWFEVRSQMSHVASLLPDMSDGAVAFLDMHPSGAYGVVVFMIDYHEDEIRAVARGDSSLWDVLAVEDALAGSDV